VVNSDSMILSSRSSSMLHNGDVSREGCILFFTSSLGMSCVFVLVHLACSSSCITKELFFCQAMNTQKESTCTFNRKLGLKHVDQKFIVNDIKKQALLPKNRHTIP
jgi:hypothetical protein